MKKQLFLKIYGKVQGVFFRQFIKEKADHLELNGYVANKSDGSVEVVAEGTKERLDKLIEVSKKGTIYSNVKQVKLKWLAPTDKFKNFNIAF